ncbi:MAG: M20 family metallopeptidase [Candidatus Izemoplasmatales bacterium]
MVKVKDLEYLLPYLVKTRRYLHAHPETGFDLEKTHDFVMNELLTMGIEVIPHVGKNSLLGILKNGNGPVIGLRADMDALPLQEMNKELSYCSKNDGKMHACGHDAHTAMLLTAATYLSTHLNEWEGTVYFVFQEAEEGPNPGGAYGIVESGLLEKVERFYAFHVSSLFESGKIAAKKNEAMASADTIQMTLFGKGAHAAYPHLGIDPIIMASEVIQATQLILSRKKNPLTPAVITIAQVHAGTTHNIIPDSAYLEGTVRTFSYELRDWIKEEIKKVLEAVSIKNGGSYKYEYIYEYDPTINTPSEVDYVQKIVHQTLGEEAFIEILEPSMGAEDFSRYIKYRQGCMLWLGTKKSDETSYSLHHPKFNLDEEALLTGSTTFVNIISSFRKGE